MAVKIGKAKYGQGKKNFKIAEGDNIYGILPPLFDLADKGRWSMYYDLEWGYKDSKGKNRPFQSPRVVNRKTKMVEVESAAHLRREALKASKEALVEQFKAGKATQDQVKEAVELCERYNREAKHYVNVITPNLEIGLLKLGYKAKLALDEQIKQLRSKGTEAIGLTGVFFNFHKSYPTSNRRDAITTVLPYQENIEATMGNGQKAIVQQKKTYTLDDSIINRLEDEAYRLDTLYPVVSAEQVEDMVVNGMNGVDRVMGVSEGHAVVEETEEDDQPFGEENLVPGIKIPAKTMAAPAPVAPKAATVQAPVVQVQIMQPAVAQLAPKAAVVQSVTSVMSQSDEDFLKSVGAL